MTHIVKQGEYLSGLARQYGFSSYRTLWFHPENAELRKKRQNPNILFPGDSLFIPEIENKRTDGVTEKCHVFQKSGDRLKLRLMLKDIYNGPLADARCELRLGNDGLPGQSHSNGRLDQEIPITCETASLLLGGKKDPLENRVTEIKIGHLDPVEEMSGQAARLQNLGYYRTSVEEIDKMEFRYAVEEFQCDHGLVVDGKCGPQTQARLKSEHGC
jgi:hypothetical protein